MGSADWMPRNLYERVEVLVPLRDEMLRERVRHEILDAYLADNRKSRILLKDATYMRAWQPLHGARNRRMPTGTTAFSAQDFLMSVAEGKIPAAIPAPVATRKRKVVGKER
jgi:polyphosphate kinase